MPYEILSHTADTGIEATSTTFTGLVADLASGMFALMAEPGPGGESKIEVVVSASDPEDLVVDVLSELLYQSEVEDVLLGDIEVEQLRELELKVSARGVSLGGVQLTGPPIKAVTYHQVGVQQTKEGWRARVFFDV